MEAYSAICRDCEWDRQFPARRFAEHAKRTHEDWTGHVVVLERED
jgi:RNA polymerase subunit RPABC4/transcription elongation factor Spt4